MFHSDLSEKKYSAKATTVLLKACFINQVLEKLYLDDCEDITFDGLTDFLLR